MGVISILQIQKLRQPRQLAPRLDLELSLRCQNDCPRAYAMLGLSKHYSPSVGVCVRLIAGDEKCPGFQQLLDCLREQPGWPVLGAMTAWVAESGLGVCPREGGRVIKKVKGTHTHADMKETGQLLSVQRNLGQVRGKQCLGLGAQGKARA